MASPFSMIENVGSVVVDETTKLKDHGKQAIRSLLAFEDLPEWMQGDPYIRRGYRKQLDSLTECYESLFYLHNESVNIWSHLLAGVFFFALLLTADYSIFHAVPEIAVSDAVAVQLYLAGATGCLFLSAFYHCTTSRSHEISRRYLKLDYLGIVLNITSTCISAAYFGLCGDRSLQAIYISAITVCGTTTFWLVLDPDMDGHNAAFWRALVFIALGCSGFAPIVHMFVKDGLNGLSNFPIGYICGSSLLYLIGTAIYVTRRPEKWWPGLFDYWNLARLQEVRNITPRFASLAEDVIKEYQSALPSEATDKQLPGVLKRITRYEVLMDCMWDEAQRVDPKDLKALQGLKVQRFFAVYEMLGAVDAAMTTWENGPQTSPRPVKAMHENIDRAGLAILLETYAGLFDIRMHAKRNTISCVTKIHQHIKDRKYGFLGKEILIRKRQVSYNLLPSLEHFEAESLAVIERLQDECFEYLEFDKDGDHLNDMTFDLKPQVLTLNSQQTVR
ncbi:hypothetical protein MMC15_006719 [Xylographa vitiligo]|nr:hypothetical protein [Xylographa vitiligo]